MKNYREYNCSLFHGGAVSYAAQGVCGKCHEKGAAWAVKHGKHWRAYCQDCFKP
jgi:hypothetical protein